MYRYHYHGSQKFSTDELERLKSAPGSWSRDITVHCSQGYQYEFYGKQDERNMGRTEHLSHFAAIGPGGVLQIVLRNKTVYFDDLPKAINPESGERAQVVQAIVHEIALVLGPSQWQQVEAQEWQAWRESVGPVESVFRD